MKVVVIAGTVLALGAVPGSAQDPTPEQEAALFQLFTRCKPVYPTVAVERTSAKLEDLSNSQLEEVVLTGLRSDGLLSEKEGTPFLYVAVGIVDWAFVVRIELLKLVDDRETDIVGAAPTWRTYRYGIHGGDPEFLLSSLGTAMRRFLDDYLLVNEGACGASGNPPADTAASTGVGPQAILP